MKNNRLFIALMLFIMASPVFMRPAFAGARMDDVLGKLGLERETVKYHIESGWFHAKKGMDERCTAPNYRPTPKEWKKRGVGLTWTGKGTERWFLVRFAIPEQVAGVPIKGSKAVFHAAMTGNGDIWVNGIYKSSFRYDNGEALLGKQVAPGEKYVVVVRGVSNGSAAMFTDAYLTFSALEAPQRRIKDYVDKVQTVQLLFDQLNETEKERWEQVLEESAAKVDLDALSRNDMPALLESLDAASVRLDEFGGIAKKYTMYLLGYSHIDLAWLWDYREGEKVWHDTAKTVFELMEEYPDFIFTETQAHGYKWMEDDYPKSIYAKLHKWYDAGRWEITGGTWTEHDSNLPSGEGFVRQFLYGKKYFRDKFDKDVVVAWTPDSFGYNWNLPQILKKSGMTGFLTQKINWNDTTKFPYHIFWWEGPDGSKILTYFPVGGYGESVDANRMLQQLKEMKRKHDVDENFVIFGVGDHGGGVTRRHLDRAFALKKNPVYPKIEFTTAEKYFKHLHKLAEKKDFPVWDDELYLQYHRGTYTTQAATKRNNRRGEIQMQVAEKFAAVADKLGSDVPYPFREIFGGWYYIMLNQMHDILPGSGIRKVYEDAEKDYAKQHKLGNMVLDNALDSITSKIDTSGIGNALVVFNPLSWKRDGIVELALDELPAKPAILSPAGATVPSQIVDNRDGGKSLVFIARDIPSIGYAVCRVVAASDAAPAPVTDLTADGTTIENTFLKLTLDPESGEIASLLDKQTGKEIIRAGAGGAVLQLYNDKPAKYDAWNIRIGDPVYMDRVGRVELVENGPVRATLKMSHRVGGSISTFDQYFTLYENRPLADGRIEVEWQESNVIAKLAFNLDMMNETAWFEIPYAAIERRAVPLTPADRAKWEVSAQKWVDYTDKSGTYGVGLLNNSKYGYDVKDNVLRMTLLRSPVAPDPLADRGHHSIPYALYPHAGDWRDANVPRKGYEFNWPLITRLSDSHAGELPVSESFFRCEPPNVLLNVVKKAENKKDYIIRFYETSGIDTEAKITLPGTPASVVETNLIEDEMEPVPFDGNRISVPIGHYEIKTLRVSF